MAKIVYETALLVCSSCVIFTGTLSAVLLMLAWPNDRILGLSTRLVIGLCFIIVAIFSIGFVGTIAESTRALLIFACLLILFPVSILLVEIIFRLSSLGPTPVAVSTVSANDTKSSRATNSSIQIFSNSLTSDSVNALSRMKTSPPDLHNNNASLSQNLISASPQSTLYLLSPLHPSQRNVSLSPASPSPVLPTNFYQLFDQGHDSSSLPATNRSSLAESNNPNQNDKRVKYFGLDSNFWSDIFTTSLSPRLETLVEYVLVGMLAFVLFQIVIAYLLASEIHALRSELALFTHKLTSSQDDQGGDSSKLETMNRQPDPANFTQDLTFYPIDSQCPQQVCVEPNYAYSDQAYKHTHPIDSSLVQVHVNPEFAAQPSDLTNFVTDNKQSQFAGSSQSTNGFSSSVSSCSSSSALTRSRRSRATTTFRVTFDSAPEYVTFEPNEPTTIQSLDANDHNFNYRQHEHQEHQQHNYQQHSQ